MDTISIWTSLAVNRAMGDVCWDPDETTVPGEGTHKIRVACHDNSNHTQHGEESLDNIKHQTPRHTIPTFLTGILIIHSKKFAFADILGTFPPRGINNNTEDESQSNLAERYYARRKTDRVILFQNTRGINWYKHYT